MTNTANFDSLALDPLLLKRLAQLEYAKPTPIQAAAIPPALAGHDVIAEAKTGSGKTAAFALPLLQQCIQQKPQHSGRGNPIARLILAPTRELAIQIAEAINRYAADMTSRPKVVSVYGGVKINPQMQMLRGGADILVATPGRLIDLLGNNAISLSHTQSLVLDEADKMLNQGFMEELNHILAALPDQRQTLLFSATFPDELKLLIQVTLNDPVKVSVESLHKQAQIQQRVITVNQEKKNALLIHLIQTEQWSQVLVFCSAKRSCNNLLKKLQKAGLNAAAFHGDQSQGARNKALDDFKQGKTQVLIATDVAARGIDIENLPYVVNFELPRSPNDYIHRIGRTGRAGESGTAISLICHDEYHHFKVIEKRIKQQLPREQIAGYEADEKPNEPAKPKARAKPAGTGKKHRTSTAKQNSTNNNAWGNWNKK